MAKEILLYTSFNSYSVADFIRSLEDNKGSDISIRMNTPGGSVYDGYGAIAKYKEFPNSKQIKVDGRADSFGAYFLCYTNSDNVECLDVSKFTFHRASMPSWYEADARLFTDEVKGQLNSINTELRTAIESKCTAQRWKNITGVSLDDMFSLDSRIDVQIDAEKAKKLGLVGKVNKITPQKLSEIKAYSLDLAAELTDSIPETQSQPIKNTVMTIHEVKADSALLAALKTEILAEEKDRIEAFAAWKDIDPVACLDSIVKGDRYTTAFGAKMQVKAMSKEGLANMASASAAAVVNAETGGEPTEKDKEAAKVNASFASVEKDVLARFGVTAKA